MKDDSPNAPKKGCLGKVIYVDDMGTIHMEWENGSGLGLIADEDEFHIVDEVLDL